MGLPPPALRDCPLHPHYYWYLTNEGIQYLRDYLHLLLPGPVVISQRETGLHTGRRLEVRTRPVLLALDLRPWSSVEDLDVASPPSSSSVTYERNVIGCSAISRPYVALQAISHWFFRLI